MSLFKKSSPLDTANSATCCRVQRWLALGMDRKRDQVLEESISRHLKNRSTHQNPTPTTNIPTVRWLRVLIWTTLMPVKWGRSLGDKPSVPVTSSRLFGSGNYFKENFSFNILIPALWACFHHVWICSQVPGTTQGNPELSRAISAY